MPDHLVAEILDGELYTSPRPAPRHADARSGLGGALRGPFDRGRGGPGGWRILRLEDGRWTIVSTWAGLATLRAEPFEALDLDLSLLWEETPG